MNYIKTEITLNKLSALIVKMQLTEVRKECDALSIIRIHKRFEAPYSDELKQSEQAYQKLVEKLETEFNTLKAEL